MKDLRIPFVIFFTVSFQVTANSQSWKLYSDSANNFYTQNKFDAAIEYYIKAIEQLKNDSLITGSYARICNSLGNSYRNTNQHAKAEPFYLKAKEIREKVFGKESAEYASSCNNLGALYSGAGQYDKAEHLYKEAKEIRKNVLGKQSSSYAASCNNLAGIYLYTGRYDMAEPLYIEAMQIKEKISGRESLDYALSCNNLASLYMYMGLYKKSEPMTLESMRVNEKLAGKVSIEYAESCNNLALLYLYMGEYEKAEPLFLKALEIDNQVRGRDDPGYAIDCDNLGLLYREMGQYEKAEMMHLTAKGIREKILTKEHPDYARSCNNLGSLYMVTEQYNKAESLFIEAKQIREKNPGKNHPDYALSCNNLASVYANLRQYKKAESFFLETKHIIENGPGKTHPSYAISCNNLGNLYSDLYQYRKAELFFLEAYNVRKEVVGKQHPDYIESCTNLGNLYQDLINFKKANNFYEQALEAQNLSTKKILGFTSEVEQQSYLRKIANQKNKILSFNMSALSRLHQGDSYNISLSGRNLILSSSEQIRNSIYSSMDTSLKDKYYSWINAREQIAFWYAKPIAEHPAYVRNLEEYANASEKELARLSFDFRKEKVNKEITWKDIQVSLKINEAAIEFNELNYYTGKRWADSTYIALILTKNRPEPELVQLFEKKQMDSILSYKKTSPGQQKLNKLYSFQEKIINNLQEKSLYDIIWKPLEKKLKGIKTVYYSAAGSLYKIAFAALPVNNKEVLSDKYQLIQLNTTASVVDELQVSVFKSDNILLYGGVQFDADSTSIKKATLQFTHNDVATRSVPEDLLREGGSDFYFLKGSELEVEQIDKLAAQNKYKTTLFNGMMATEESIKNLSGKNSPSVLHIATHGFFFPDPKNVKKDEKIGGAYVFKQSDNPLIRSGLALAGANNAWKGKPVTGVEDGILTSYEVSNMYLPNTKLVVLSACETGLGDIQGSEGVYGLQRAFKMAGVQNLVMSLWRVDDIATSEFMQQFYKNLFAKQTIQDAFNKAQAVIKNKYRTDPYKWAAWVLIR